MFTLKDISFHLLNLGTPPVSPEPGEEKKIYWIIQTNTAYEKCNWVAKTWSIQATISSL